MKQRIFDIFSEKGYDPRQNYESGRLSFESLADGNEFIIKVRESSGRSFKFYSDGEKIFRYKHDNFFKETPIAEKDILILHDTVSKLLPLKIVKVASESSIRNALPNLDSDDCDEQKIPECESQTFDNDGEPRSKKLRIETAFPSSSPHQYSDFAQAQTIVARVDSLAKGQI